MTAWLIGMGVAVLTTLCGVIWAMLKAGARADARASQAEAYRQTRERIDHAGNDVDGASGADVERRLRDHAGE